MTATRAAGRVAVSVLHEPQRPTADRPETLRQARRFEVHKGEFLHLGLCHPCAAQGAYGRQFGFGLVRPPCADCLPLLSLLPVAAPNGWRRFAKDSASALRMTGTLRSVSSDLSQLGRFVDGAEEAA